MDNGTRGIKEAKNMLHSIFSSTIEPVKLGNSKPPQDKIS